MKDFKKNEYIELFNPGNNNYFPVRILEKTENGYKAQLLENDVPITIYNYQLKTYGYRNIWVTKELMGQLAFIRDGLIYSLDKIRAFECIIGDLRAKQNSYYLYEYNSKHLGFAVLNEQELESFKIDYEKIDIRADNHKIMKQYHFTNSINGIFSYLLENMPGHYNYEKYDSIVLENN